jgi:hypothetical protein
LMPLLRKLMTLSGCKGTGCHWSRCRAIPSRVIAKQQQCDYSVQLRQGTGADRS